MSEHEYRQRMDDLQNEISWALMEDARDTDPADTIRLATKMQELRLTYGFS